MFDLEDYPLVNTELERVEEHLDRLLQSDSQSMQEVLDWIRSSHGKMIRPTLTLLCSKLKREKTDATEIAAVIEICHTASLVHDDVIDDSDYRRGKISVQKKFGPAMAIYAGDYLIFVSVSRTGLMRKSWYRNLFSDLENICLGEIGQLDNRYNTEITEEDYIKNISGKTAALFGMACSGGGYEGKLNNEEIEAVKEYGKNIGIIFQLRDDLLDYLAAGDEAKKTTQSDFRYGYYTLPAIHAFKDPVYGPELIEISRAIASGEDQAYTDEDIKNLIEKAGGFDYTNTLIREYANRAIRALSIFRESKAKQKLVEVVNFLVQSSEQADFKE